MVDNFTIHKFTQDISLKSQMANRNLLKKNVRKELSLRASILLHYYSNKIPACSGDFQNRSELDILSAVNP